RYVVAACDGEKLRRILERPHHHRPAAERIARIGEGELEIHDHDPRLLAKADRQLAEAPLRIGIAHAAPPSQSSMSPIVFPAPSPIRNPQAAGTGERPRR